MNLRKEIQKRKRYDLIFTVVGVIALMIGVLTFMALFTEMAIRGVGRLDWDFFTNFPSRRAAQDIAATSEPASGSESAKAAMAVPAATRGR